MTLKEKLLQKSNLWHVAAVGIFFLIASVYLYPAFKGYVVDQADVRNWAGATQEIVDYREGTGEQIGWTGSMFSGMPATQISVIYEGKDIPDFLRKLYSLFLPNPIALVFIYFLSFYIMARSFKIGPLVSIVGSIAYGLSSYFIVIIEAGHNTKALAVGFAPLLIAGFIFAYRWRNWYLGVALSALFMTFQLSANHLQITYYMIFILIALGGVELYRHIKMQGGIARFAKISAALLVAYGIGIMINYGNIKGTAEYTAATTRGGSELTIKADGSPRDLTSGLESDYITAWSYGKAETFTFIIPNYKGGETGQIGSDKEKTALLKNADSRFRNDLKGMNQYWGDQPFTSGPVYIGIIVVFLSLLSLVYCKEKAIWPIFAVTILTVMLSWGKNFMGFTELFLDFMPGYNKFRAVTIILVVAELCIPLLGVFFLHKLYTAKEEIQKNLKPFLIVSGAVVFVMLVFLAMPSAVSNFLSDGEREVIATADPAQVGVYEEFFGELEKVRISIFRKDVGRSLIFLILAIGVIYAYTKNAFKANIAVGVLGVLILTDLILVDSRYLNTEASGKNYKQWIEGYKQKYPYVAGDGEKTILAFELEKNPALFIKLDSATNAVKAIPGYGELEAGEKQRLNDWSTYRTLNRYTNFRVYENGNPFNSSYTSYFNKSIGGYHGAKLGRYQELIEFHLDKRNPAVLDMLNMRYKIQPVGNNEGKIVNSSFLGENPTAMGNAWLAKEIQTVQTADEEILALNSGNLYSVNSFGSHKLLINGELDSAANVIESDTVELIYVMGIDSAGNMMSDTVPVQIPYQAVTADMPLAFILGPQGANWDYVVNVDSTEMPLVGVKSEGRAGWDPNKTTIVHQEFKANISQDSYSGNGTIEMTSYHPDHLIYNFSSAEKQLVVFSEIYYPIGWKALVDSKEVPISRVNYVLRAIEVEGGDHKIELVYEVPSMKSSAALAWAGSVLLLILIAFGIFMDSKVKDEVVEE